MFDTSALIQGLVLGLGMFMCPGPKDLQIARLALLRHPAFDLIAVGALSDVLLICLGIAGASAALGHSARWQSAALWAGVGLLGAHGWSAARRAIRGEVQMPDAPSAGSARSRIKGLRDVVSVSLFNPVAWLDTLLVIAAVGATLPQRSQPSFVLGAAIASFAWFAALVSAARWAGHLMTKRSTWRAVEACVAAIMFAMAIYLAVDQIGG
jgi:L-lysine exporter family protein LysE/ArgO